MIDPLDRRRNALRADLADVRLRGRVERARYVAPRPMTVRAPFARCRAAPGGEAVDTEFLFGETVAVFDEADGWAFVQSTVDAYVGYVPAAALAPPAPAATHVVSVPSAVVFETASIKRGIAGTLPLGARVTVKEMVSEGETFAILGGLVPERERSLGYGPVAPSGEGAFVLQQHLRPLNAPPPADWVAIAALFLGVPYVWGGKTFAGIDCSGLVQLALQAAGRDAPRDSDMQACELGEVLPGDAPLDRGDLVFWKGHVGIMMDGERLLHANGHAMLTVVEPLAGVVARLEAKGLPVTLRRRLAPEKLARGQERGLEVFG